jgi:Flp pilus assembly protein TadD
MSVLPTSAHGSSQPAPAPLPPADSPRRRRKKEAPLRLAVVVIGLCVLIIGGIAYGVFYPQVSASYHWWQAKKAIDNNDLPLALKHLNPCAKVWTTDGEVQFLLARTCRRAGYLDRVGDHLREATRRHWVPDQIKLEYLLIKAQTGYLRDIVPQLQQILKEGSRDDTYIFEALIIGDLLTNQFTEAIRWTIVWLEQHPDDWLGRYWRGAALEGAGQHQAAMQEYERALELNPHGADLHFRLAEVLMHSNPSEEALHHYEAALKADPDNHVALLGLAKCQHSLRTHDETRATLDRLLALQPQHAGAFLLYGKMAMEEDNFPEALKWLQKAYQVEPNDLVTNKNLGEVLRNLRRDDEAEQAERRTRQIEMDLVRLDDINKKLLESPKDVALRTEAGNILLKLDKANDALRWFFSAWFIDPKDKPTKEGMKKCLQKIGNKELMDRYKPLLEDQS